MQSGRSGGENRVIDHRKRLYRVLEKATPTADFSRMSTRC
jgi:hypothetical protein